MLVYRLLNPLTSLRSKWAAGRNQRDLGDGTLGLAEPFSRIRRVALLFGILTISSAVFTKAPGASIPLRTVQAQSTDIIHRPTSRPYTGDLSVFEGPQTR
jgi:hypothetical protein